MKEEWQIQIGKNKHLISGEELQIILNAGDTRFVRFRDLVVNPAFVSDMVLIRKINTNQIEAPEEVKPTQEELDRIEKKKQEIKKKLKSF